MKILIIGKITGLVLLSIALTGCGGGGGTGDATASSVATSNWMSDPITGLPRQDITVYTQSNIAPADNVLPITVGRTNKFLVSLTVCVPGSNLCQTVDKIMVDTGSVGLRIHASVLPVLQGQLPLQGQSGKVIAQCATFGNFYTWGSLRAADVGFGAHKASALPVQVYDDPALPAVSSTGCGTQIGGLIDADPAAVQFNGVLGIRGTRLDELGTFYSCQTSGKTCSTTVLTDKELLPNPIINLPQDNNGYQIVMPSIPIDGSSQVTGALVLGLNTQSNNNLSQTGTSASNMLALDSKQRVALYIDGVSYGALIDSGTSVNTLSTTNVPTCGASAPLAYCSSPITMQPIQLAAAVKPTIVLVASLYIGNWLNLLATNLPAIGTLTAKTPSTVVANGVQSILGAPFFYGKRISFGITGQTVQTNNTQVTNSFVAFN